MPTMRPVPCPVLRAMSSSISTPTRSSGGLAANIYVSGPSPSLPAPALLSLLRFAQDSCRDISRGPPGSLAVVHAFADPTYGRSSIHVVAPPGDDAAICLSSLLSDITGHAFELSVPDGGTADTPHPSVGLVDHVSILPLDGSSPASKSARALSESLEKRHGMRALLYGTACPCGGTTVESTLAHVRRTRTNFFGEGAPADAAARVACVGSPPLFTENWNVRLRAADGVEGGVRTAAVRLARALRERDGGLTGVEALSLAYGVEEYEVACNLLDPDRGSSDMIEERVREWIEMPSPGGGTRNDDAVCLSKSYRVGTTRDMCIEG